MAGKCEGPVIGIDLGATNTKVAVWRNGAVEFITDEKGNRSFPTYLAFTDDEHHIAEAAKQHATLDPATCQPAKVATCQPATCQPATCQPAKVATCQPATCQPANVVYGFTHLVGKSASDIQTQIGELQFALTPGPNNKSTITVQHKGEEKQLTPEETTTMFLQKLRERAEAQLGTSVKYAVIAVPDTITDEQRNAAIAAGFLHVELVTQTSAVATAYSYRRSARNDGKKVLVADLDLGVGRFNLSFLDPSYYMANRGPIDKFGMSFPIGGKTETGPIEGIGRSSNMATHELGDGQLDKMPEWLEKCLSDAEIDKDSIGDVVLAGEWSEMPEVRQKLDDWLGGKEPWSEIAAEDLVASGAAVIAAMSSGQEGVFALMVTDQAPFGGEGLDDNTNTNKYENVGDIGTFHHGG